MSNHKYTIRNARSGEFEKLTENKITGGVVYISDMKYYGSGGTATKEQNASGFRLLAADPSIRGKGIGFRLLL